MRYVYGTFVAVLAILVLILMVQNLQSVTVAFLTMRLTLPVFFLVLVTYVLGMFTGSSLVGLLRSLLVRTRRPKEGAGP